MNDHSFTDGDEKTLHQIDQGKATEIFDPLNHDENTNQNGNYRNNPLDSNISKENDLHADDIEVDYRYSDESSDSSDENDGEPYNDPTMTLTERRAFNIERNHKLLSSLGMMNTNNTVKGTSKLKQSRSSEHSNSDIGTTQSLTHEPSRGMIIPSCWALRQRPPPESTHTSVSFSLSQLQQRYPHRSIQIRKLYSLISAPIHSNCITTATSSATHNTPFVSPPIIVTGAAGCGKTSIVRDVVTHICSPHTVPSSPSHLIQQQQQQQLVLHAYVDCTTLDNIQIEDFLAAVYTQWFQQVPKRNVPSHHPVKSKPRKHAPPTSMKEGNPNKDEPQKRVSRMRQAKTTTRNSTLMTDTHHQHLSVTGNRVPGTEQNVGAQNSVFTAIWTFGRSIQRFLARIRRDHPNYRSTRIPLVLIVDHAEVLLCMGTTYSKSSHADRINFLVQLMLLPRTIGLNLTIIFISKNILLEHIGS
jgi:Cdc6-like AAA superfamily ATPase